MGRGDDIHLPPRWLRPRGRLLGAGTFENSALDYHSHHYSHHHPHYISRLLSSSPLSLLSLLTSRPPPSALHTYTSRHRASVFTWRLSWKRLPNPSSAPPWVLLILRWTARRGGNSHRSPRPLPRAAPRAAPRADSGVLRVPYSADGAAAHVGIGKEGALNEGARYRARWRSFAKCPQCAWAGGMGSTVLPTLVTGSRSRKPRLDPSYDAFTHAWASDPI